MGHLTAADLRRWKADPAGALPWMKDWEADQQKRADIGLAQMAGRLAAGGERQQVAARLLMGDAEGAAALAERSNDAQAYQMAWTACGATSTRTTSPSCAGLSIERWAALDPTDARPWLRQLGEASRRGDATAIDAALAEAAARPRLSRGSQLLEVNAAQVAELVADPMTRAQVLIRVVGMDAAMPGFDAASPLKACSGEALQRPQRLQQCRAVARQTLAAAGDLMEASVAQRLAERSGVPREQQAYDAETLKAASTAFQDRALRVVGFDCAAMDRMNDFSAQRAARGELAIALSLLPPR